MSAPVCSRRLRRAKPALGFSLIELMIGMALGLALLSVVVKVFADTSASRSELQRAHLQITNGRDAVDLLTDELWHAGYYGELDATGLSLPGTLPDPCSTDTATWSTSLLLHVQGYDDGVGRPSCLPASYIAGSDVLVVRRVRTCAAGSGSCEPAANGLPYLQVSLCGSSPDRYVLGVMGTDTFDLTRRDCTTAASLRRYVVHIYFLSSNNGLGDEIPTLKRLELTTGGFTEVPLIEGIERLEVEYGIDGDGDGRPDAYTPNPGTYAPAGCSTCSEVPNWSNVVTAKLHVLARAPDRTPGYSDRKRYVLGADASGNARRVGPFNDGFRRHVYSGAARIVNPAGLREVP